jgi:acyl-CoA reductase-like NAD-dependent aldehyde dehydrogenase
LVVNPPEDSAIVREESFGPVIAVQIVDSVEEAINLVNDDDYGLTASIWTRDQKCGEAIARQLHVGTASVNEHVLTAAVPHLPWGGVKQSGIGRTRSREGILAMTVPQVISTERFRLPIDPFSYPYTRWKKSLVRRLIYLIAGPTWRERLRGLWRL